MPKKYPKKEIKSERVKAWQTVFAEAGRRCVRETRFGECMRRTLEALTGKPIKGRIPAPVPVATPG
ncbi:MAG: hypothetical protein QXZ31_03730 [Thermofilaceae archaeon]